MADDAGPDLVGPDLAGPDLVGPDLVGPDLVGPDLVGPDLVGPDLVGPDQPWGTGLTVAGFVAAVTAAAIVVLSMGMIRVHPMVAIGLNLVAVGGLAPTLWGWRTVPVRRWFVLGAGVGVAIGWIALFALALG